MRISIHQPNYAPWIGYFAKMAAADVFVFLDSVQMPIGRSYVSRVKIRSQAGQQWLSVPVSRVSGERINQVRFANECWAAKHLNTLQAVYGRCPFFNSVMGLIKPLYADPGENLASFNERLLSILASYLRLAPRFVRASEIGVEGDGTELLINIIKRVGGTSYISGKGGMKYQDPHRFKEAGIALNVREYKAIPCAPLQGDFLPGLSILDALFYLGLNTVRLLEYPRLDTE